FIGRGSHRHEQARGQRLIARGSHIHQYSPLLLATTLTLSTPCAAAISAPFPGVASEVEEDLPGRIHWSGSTH
ncbi:hypothetical protein, partial [Parabacteroides distasonis]|uniref:hypothetical protein n=1 Tax=Parabacteroides distasonis TaxID=823 RepID=UPI0019D65ABC